MREAQCSLEFYDNTEDNEYSVDIVSTEGGVCNAEISVGRTRGAAKTKARKVLETLLASLDDLDEDA